MPAEITLQVAEEVSEPPPAEADFKRWADCVASHVERTLALTVRVVGPAESQQLNSDYRGRDKPTNVLSFPFEPPPGIPWDDPFVGDLALCADVIRAEANEQNKPERDHWAHMIIHGTLHLLGYDHQNDAEAMVMETLETRLLGQLNIADPYRMSGETQAS